MDVPVMPQFLYAGRDTQVKQTVRRLVIEIGFYDEDLPAPARSILE